jgi:molybdate transport system substrate-binding protein
VRTTLLVLCLAASPAGQGAPEPRPITVSAAVSLTDALSAIAADYANAGRGRIRFNFGASNVLARQIVQGAPVDLFISADEAQLEIVARAALIKEGSRVDLLGNQLAVVVPSDRPRTFSSIAQIADPAFRRIALGDPAAVPAGIYAKQYLEMEGLWKSVEPRVVPSASVRAALAAVEAGGADAAIVYRTDARSALRATVAWVVPSDRGPRIVYPAAVVSGSRNADEAARFLDYLRSADAARVFGRFGFTVLRAGSGQAPAASANASATQAR